MSQRYALIIGGTRNLGPDLAAALVDAGFHVTVLNRGVTQASSLVAGIERLYADRSDKQALAAAVGGRKFDAVVDTTLYNGPDGTAAGRLFLGRVGRYVMLSTGQVYLVRAGLERPFVEASYDGPTIAAPPESSRFDFDNWSYGIHKRSAEDALRASGLPLTVLRLPMVNSERDHFFRLRNYLARARDGGPVLIPAEEPHLPLRHVYGKDVVRAVIRAIDAEINGAFNIGQDETSTIDQFLSKIGAASLRVPGRVLWETGLMPQCSPFSEPWMSALDNRLGKAALGVRYTRFDEYLEALMRDFIERPFLPLPGYEQRPRELEVAREVW
jgi:nucleoside-diphosphate-sugar epimerase